MLGGNLGSLLYGDVSMMALFNKVLTASQDNIFPISTLPVPYLLVHCILGPRDYIGPEVCVLGCPALL